MSGPPAPAWVLTAALALAGAVGYLATRATTTPSIAPDPGADGWRAAVISSERSTAKPPAAGRSSAAPASTPTPVSPDQRGAIVEAESARMFAAEPALADLIEDASSDDVAVREQAQLALEQIDLDRLRETVTPLQR